MKARTFLLFLTFCALHLPLAVLGQVTLQGVYQGKNIYIQNPLSEDNRTFCTRGVIVNGRLLIEQPNTSAFEIDLSFLQIGEEVNIKIEHKNSCEPKIINPQVVRSPGRFAFSDIHLGKHNITWQTKGERPGGKFFVEQWVNNEWVIRHTIDGKGEAAVYALRIDCFSGNNRFRIKHLQNDGIIFYSEEQAFESNEDPVTFYPLRVAEKIVLSKPTDYKVTSVNGTPLAKGKGKEIPLQHLRTGVYYLYIENRQEKFFKK
ncbi:T9SS C-terminal target domain-containing protein [Roseivirga sp. BDSF3-8]|uniref:T9SS C-terminal target domain-containing protein n=1 Tax=Roseivirga sp. BDSF3-8 TaxID=3241598 RepID=UPI003531944C